MDQLLFGLNSTAEAIDISERLTTPKQTDYQIINLSS